jgi:Acetyltransferase (GNAT) family
MALDPLQLAEEFTLHLPPRPGYLRIERDDWILTTGQSGASVTRIRLAPESVAQAVTEIRGLLAGADVDRIAWWCGTRSTPADLPERLTALGLVPDEFVPVLASLVLERPPAGEPSADVRRIETFEDFRVGQEIDWEGWGFDERVREQRRASLERVWASTKEQGAVYYLASLDGKPVGSARAFFVDGAVLLMGSATLPSVRGRGVYVSLVHARWQEAVAHGTPSLVVQAGPLSCPILERLGFERLGEISLLVDRL